MNDAKMNPPLTLDKAREILFDIEPKLISIEQLAHVVFLAATEVGGDAKAIGELGNQIEAIARDIREEAFAWAEGAGQ
jgi:hypothetical protein